MYLLPNYAIDETKLKSQSITIMNALPTPHRDIPSRSSLVNSQTPLSSLQPINKARPKTIWTQFIYLFIYLKKRKTHSLDYPLE